MDGSSWGLTTGAAGIAGQALGLAEAVGLAVAVKTARLRAPWCWLPGHWVPRALSRLEAGGDPLVPPWPDLLITCGRRSVAFSIAIRRASGGRTFTVHIQNPQVPLRHFDLVAAPLHDGLSGANVIATVGAPHRITPARLEEGAARFAPRFAGLPRPLVGVLVGGSNKYYRLTPAVAADIVGRFRELVHAHGAGLVVTASRRTGAESAAILKHGLADLPALVWDGTGDNPYLGILALADVLVVTCDSVSMVSEALATGKPVYVIELAGGKRRFRDFHARLSRQGLTRPFDGTLARWSYPPPADTERVAAAVRERLAQRRAG